MDFRWKPTVTGLLSVVVLFGSYLNGGMALHCFVCDNPPDCYHRNGSTDLCPTGIDYCTISAGNSYPKGPTMMRGCYCSSKGVPSSIVRKYYTDDGDRLWERLPDLRYGLICQDRNDSIRYQDQRRHNFYRICVCKGDWCNGHDWEAMMRAPSVHVNAWKDPVSLAPLQNPSYEYHRNLWHRLDLDAFGNRTKPTIEQQLERIRNEPVHSPGRLDHFQSSTGVLPHGSAWAAAWVAGAVYAGRHF